jgi:hypothetical protein
MKMILVHLNSGKVIKVDPRNRIDADKLHNPEIQPKISRVAIVTDKGNRIDLPKLKSQYNRVWSELVNLGSTIRGERLCIRYGRTVLKSTYYYSDDRIVVDIY